MCLGRSTLLVLLVRDAELLGEAEQLKDARDVALRTGHDNCNAMLVGARHRTDQHADARRIDVGHLGEVNFKTADVAIRKLRDCRIERLAKLRCVRDVHLSRHADKQALLARRGVDDKTHVLSS